MQSTIAMGFCPSFFSPHNPFQFIAARAVYSSQQRQWLPLGNSATQFPPKGTFYVREDLIPESFSGPAGNLAAWALEDQADWQSSGLGARFRATLLRQPPVEIVAIGVASSDVDAIQRLLLEEGVSFTAGLAGRPILLEFLDNIVVGPFELQPLSDNLNRYVCSPTALANPCDTWPTHGPEALSRFVLSLSDHKRIFASTEPLPKSHGSLFIAPLEQLLRRAQLAGGIGSQRQSMPADLEKLVGSLRHALESLPPHEITQAIYNRLLPLTERAELTLAGQEELDHFLAKHPLFEEAVRRHADSQVAQLRDSVRMEVLNQEALLQQNIAELERRYAEEREKVELDRQEEEQRAAKRRQELESELARLQVDRDNLTRAVEQVRHETDSRFKWQTSITQSTRMLKSSTEAVEHLTKNLARLGMLPVSAQNTAREAFVAASLGQMLLFRGSFALSVARVVAQSLAGGCIHRLSVPVGLITPLPRLPSGSGDQMAALLIEGVNRSCFDAYSGELSVMLEERCLGLRSGSDPLVVGTLLDGASSVPPSPELLSCGPVFSTEHLSWKASLRAEPAIPGSCTTATWAVDARPFNATLLVPDNAGLPLRGRRNAAAAGALLAGLGATDKGDAEDIVHASLLFGWIYPGMANGGGTVTDLLEEYRQRWESAADKDQQRLGRLLRGNSEKEKA